MLKMYELDLYLYIVKKRFVLYSYTYQVIYYLGHRESNYCTVKLKY